MRIGVVGGGLMGSGIAEVCARAGVDVTVVEADDERAERSRAAIEKSLDRAVRGGKRELFTRMDKILPEAQFLASNTSSVPIMKLGAGTSQPDRVLGLHFFNPVPVLPLVEIVTSIMTTPETVERARSFAEGTLGKQCIDSQDRAGFVVNALLIPYLL